ncbi:MAG TPA: CAP domain-containing protein [Gaiellaceae bacterium]|nr:CAP domain-containing protein [Gaiellaceae bacterium]
MPRVALAAIAAVFAAACLVPAAAMPAPARAHRAANAMAVLDQGVLQQLNEIRAQHGLVPLRLSAKLSAAAAQHSREMAADGYFQHNSYDGTAFWKRIQRFYGATGYGFWSVGENLLWSSPDVDAAGALQLWMHSPEHRANILTARWREIGIAAVHVASAPGAYHGLPVTIITTDFGVRH